MSARNALFTAVGEDDSIELDLSRRVLQEE